MNSQASKLQVISHPKAKRQSSCDK